MHTVWNYLNGKCVLCAELSFPMGATKNTKSIQEHPRTGKRL